MSVNGIRNSKNPLLKNILRPSYDKNYRNKHLWTVGVEHQKGKCNLCTQKLCDGNMIMDHIVQKRYIDKYGDNIDKMENFQVLCSSCNHIKTYQVDSKINKLIKENDSKTRTYNGIRIYIMNLLRKIYRDKQESLAKVKETTNQDNDSSDSSQDESDKEKDKKSIEKVFSKLINLQNEDSENDDIEYDSLSDLNNKSDSDSLSDLNNKSDSVMVSNLDSKSKKPVQKERSPVIRTRTKSGSLPKKIVTFSESLHSSNATKDNNTHNLIIAKHKQNVTLNKRKFDYDSDDEICEEEIMITKKVNKDETSQKKKDGKFISLIFRNCNFNNCSI